MMEGIWGWDATPATPQWRKVIVDATGHLQVDVITAGGTASHCYGWDGGNWQTLLVESAALYNLRVKLYDGANAIATVAASGDVAAATRGLFSHSVIRAWDGTDFKVPAARAISEDNIAQTWAGLFTKSCLHGFDGTYWDRLRTYSIGILKVGRAAVGLSNCAMRSSDVQVKAAAGAVYWITVSDTAALAIELNDSIGDGGVDRWGIDLPVGGYIHCVFDLPLEFTTGIWLDVSTATCKVSIGYL